MSYPAGGCDDGQHAVERLVLSSTGALQMEVLILSASGFSTSAAYSALPAAAVILPKESTTCKFSDYLARCAARTQHLRQQ